MTGTHFLGCACCGVYDRHNEVVQTTSALFKLERPQILWLNQLCGEQLYRCRHLRPRNSARPTDGQVWGSPLTQKRVAFDMSIVDPNAPVTQVPARVHAASRFSTRECTEGPA